VVIVRLLAVVVAACVAVAGCDSDTPTPTVHTTAPPHVVVGPAGSSTEAYTLDLLDGAETVQIVTGNLHGHLYRIATPVDTTALASAHVESRTVNVTVAGSDAELDITLDRGVPWNLRFSAGVTTVSADMSAGRLTGLTAVQGISTLDITAAAPQSRVTLTELAGVSAFALHTSDPAVVSARVRAGAGSVSMFGRIHHGVPGGARFDSPDIAPSSYTIDAVGGVGSLTVDAAK
jgi:hypothetical protein